MIAFGQLAVYLGGVLALLPVAMAIRAWFIVGFVLLWPIALLIWAVFGVRVTVIPGHP